MGAVVRSQHRSDPSDSGYFLPSHNAVIERIEDSLESPANPVDHTLSIDSDDLQRNVGMLIFNSGVGKYGRTCSGTFLSPRLFLTAAHCFRAAKKEIRRFDGKNNRYNIRMSEPLTSLGIEEMTPLELRNWQIYSPFAGISAIEKVSVFCFRPNSDEPCERHEDIGRYFTQDEKASNIVDKFTVGFTEHPEMTDYYEPPYQRPDEASTYSLKTRVGDLAIATLSTPFLGVRGARLAPQNDDHDAESGWFARPLVIDSGDDSISCYEHARIDESDDLSKLPLAREALAFQGKLENGLRMYGFGMIPSHEPGTSGIMRSKRGLSGTIDVTAIGPFDYGKQSTEKCVYLPRLVLSKPSGRKNYPCPGDSGSGLFSKDGHLTGIFWSIPRSLRPYDQSRCRRSVPTKAVFGYLEAGPYFDWIEKIVRLDRDAHSDDEAGCLKAAQACIGELSPDASGDRSLAVRSIDPSQARTGEVPFSVRSISLEGRFGIPHRRFVKPAWEDEYSQYSLIGAVDTVHKYSVKPSEVGGLCEKLDARGMVISLSHERGEKAGSLVDIGNQPMAHMALFVDQGVGGNFSASEIFGPILENESDQIDKSSYNPSRKIEAALRVGCSDTSTGIAKSCEIRGDVCGSLQRYFVLVERISSGGRYNVNVNVWGVERDG